MRLFIAINFNEQIKNFIYDVIQKFKTYTLKGNFTLKDNLHLTLVFLGEIPYEKVEFIQDAMDSVNMDKFKLLIKGIGSFKRNGGDIFWIGVERNKNIFELYNNLYEELTKRGFAIESREFKPHLTIGREVALKDGFDKDAFADTIGQISVNVDKISLMKSERINGKLVYTEIYAKPLGK